MAQRSRRTGFTNDPIDVLAHRESDDCAWWFGRECDCSAPGDFADKMRELNVTLVSGIANSPQQEVANDG